MAAAHLISVDNVNHYYGSGPLRKQILFEISTNFHPGEIVILTGPSGSGKTTLLTLAGALRSVQEGSLTVLGQQLNGASRDQLSAIRRSIGFIFQAHNLLDALTARQNVQMSLVLHGVRSQKEADQRAVTMLESVGLGQRMDYHPAQLSGGQKQRVAIARALVAQPKIVLADEPTAALDRKSGREVVELLQHLARKQGTTILLVTHDNRILDVADRILTLEDGRIASFAHGLTTSAGQMLGSLAQLNRRGTLARHLRDLPPDKFLRVFEDSTQELEQLLRTLEMAERQVSESMLDQVIEGATWRVVDLMRAERGTVFWVDSKEQKLRSKIATTDGAERLCIVMPLNQGIAGHVARTGQIANVPNAREEPLFNPDTDEATGFLTRSVLCVPVRNRLQEIIAVAQVLNRRDGLPFDSADEKRFCEFAQPLGLVLESCQRLGELHSLSSRGPALTDCISPPHPSA